MKLSPQAYLFIGMGIESLITALLTATGVITPTASQQAGCGFTLLVFVFIFGTQRRV